MPSAELTSTQAPKQLVTDLDASHPRSTQTVVSGHGAGFGPSARPEAVGREAKARPTAKHRRGPAAFQAIGLWLLRALTDSAGAWALAAGAPLDAYHAEAMAGGIVTAINPTYTEADERAHPARSGPGLARAS